MPRSTVSLKPPSTREGRSNRPDPPDPTTLTSRQYARRERIINAALRLVLEQEYELVQMRDVAEAAEVALGTIYRYFGSKEHLFAAVFLAWQTSMSHAMVIHPPERTDNVGRLTEIAFRAIRAFEHHPTFYPLLLMMSTTTDPWAQRISEQTGKHSESLFAEPLVGIAPQDRAVIVNIIGAMLETSLRRWLAGGITIDQVYENMAHVIAMLRLPS
jgi:AcrR family transcriptional regulator